MRLEEEGIVEGEAASSMLEVSAPEAGVEPAVVYPSVFVGPRKMVRGCSS